MHAGADSWLTVPSVGRIAGFGLLVFALLVFYEQVKMFLYRRAATLTLTQTLTLILTSLHLACSVY